MTATKNKPVVILHLSDIHFGNDGSDQSAIDSKEAILNSLTETISALPSNWKPTVVCISGDVAWRAKSEEYERAEGWLKKLLNALSLSAEELIICPGNHDIDRTLAQDPPSDHQTADKLFSLPISESDLLHQPFKEYSSFCSRMKIPSFACGESTSDRKSVV